MVELLNKIWIFVQPYLAEIVTAIVGVIVGACTLATNHLTRKTIKDLKCSDNVHYYIVCPRCSHKIHLEEAEILEEKTANMANIKRG